MVYQRQGDFVKKVKPAFIELFERRLKFKADSSALITEEIESEVNALKELEHKVLVTWAEATENINKNMMDWVEEGKFTFTPSVSSYLEAMLFSDEDFRKYYPQEEAACE